MPKNTSWKKLVQKLHRLGYDGPYAGGRHLIMKRGNVKIIIPNPHYSDISGHLVAEILRQAGISNKDWDKA